MGQPFERRPHACHPLSLRISQRSETTANPRRQKVEAKQTNIQRLEAAGILNVEHFSPADTKVIETITPEEVDVLIRLGKRMGPTAAGAEMMRPNFPV
jgi:hypothetical protein